VISYEFIRLTAVFILDLVDDFARQRALSGSHPRPFGPVHVLLMARTLTTGVREVFTPPRELVTVRNPSGFDLFFGQSRSADGVRRLPLPDGQYELRIESAYYQARNVTVAVPRPPPVPQPQPNPPPDPYPPPTLLAPGFDYPFPQGTTVLRGSVQLPDGRGETGVRVLTTVGTAPYVTDATGQWALLFPAITQPTRVTVAYRRPNTPDQRAAVTVVPGAVTSLPATALAGQVFDGPRGAGGATVQVGGFAPAVPAQADGRWTYVFAINQTAANADVTAVLPDRRQQTVLGVAITPKRTTAVPAIRF
jgi:hypothetical protein